MSRRAQGRYEPTRKARMPANGLAVPPTSRNVATALAVVPDPMEPGEELYVSTNRHCDVLEMERSHKRISEAAYRIGRDLQRTFEAGARIGSGAQWREGDRVDASWAKEKAILRNVEIARSCDNEMKRLTFEVGIIGASFLRTILTGVTFADHAAQTAGANPSKREVAQVAQRFRSLLEDIVALRTALGSGNGQMRVWIAP